MAARNFKVVNGRMTDTDNDMSKPLSAPRMRTIDEVSKLTGLSYTFIRKLCLNGKIVHVKTGRKYLVNLDKFYEYLNTGDKQENVSC
ncbi:MAG: excisionase family DNA-binding protein [Lachnospiraceae bacterium]|nr:excisionase family DNA-binding protein [Lachnospiraceae bacterium]